MKIFDLVLFSLLIIIERCWPTATLLETSLVPLSFLCYLVVLWICILVQKTKNWVIVHNSTLWKILRRILIQRVVRTIISYLGKHRLVSGFQTGSCFIHFRNFYRLKKRIYVNLKAKRKSPAGVANILQVAVPKGRQNFPCFLRMTVKVGNVSYKCNCQIFKFFSSSYRLLCCLLYLGPFKVV